MDIALLRQSIRTFARMSFSRSGGPGGQNVNKVNTKVTLRLDLRDLEGLSEGEISRVRKVLAGRMAGENEILISSDEERSQYMNRERVFVRLEALVAASARLPRVRRPTKPSAAAREKRLNTKRRRALKKSERRFKPED